MKTIKCCTPLLILLLLEFLNLWKSVATGRMEVRCPEYCKCDVYTNLRRAVCRNKRLVTMELNVPPQAEILDLSGNQISELGDKIFLETGLTNLKQLNLSHNNVRQIHLNGFKGLEKLKSLDLSNNAIEYFIAAWFESLQSLEELYLRGNKLRGINEEPLIDIKNLRILDLSKCGLTSLKSDTLRLTPNLQVLDISENYIQIIEVELINVLPKLKLLKTHDNHLKCKDRRLLEFATKAKSRGIHFTNSCIVHDTPSFVINDRVQKFEKMQISVEPESTLSTSTPRNSWIVEETSTRIVEVCSNGSTRESNSDSIVIDVIQLSPWISVTIIFVYGILCGTVLTCGINLYLSKRETRSSRRSESTRNNAVGRNTIARGEKRNFPRRNSIFFSALQNAKRQMSRERLDDDDDDHGEVLVMNEFDLASSTPVAARKYTLS